MKLSIRHETHYEYSAPLQYALQHLCLTPQANAHQAVEAWHVSAPGQLYAQRDGWGNLAHSWSMARQRDARHVFRPSEPRYDAFFQIPVVLARRDARLIDPRRIA